MNKDNDYEQLIKERSRLLERLANWPPILRGSLREHLGRCGNPNCRCRDKKNPVLHGPYRYLSHRYQSRTQTILLTKSKLPHAKAWVTSYKQMISTIYDLSEINFRLLRYHHQKLKDVE